jgi:hypothetical protein
MAIGKHNDYCEHGMIGLVFIEPELPPSQPLLDELTDRVNKLVEKHIKPDTNWGNSWRGVHTCSCGVRSDNYDHYFIPPGENQPTHITHSLLVHYVMYHREEIPLSDMEELNKVLALVHL